MAESDRDILIELRTKVGEIHRDMTQPEGRVPKLEATVEGHGKQINTFSGGLRTALWFIAGICTLLLAGVSEPRTVA
jgi:hypothetical protein